MPDFRTPTRAPGATLTHEETANLARAIEERRNQFTPPIARSRLGVNDQALRNWERGDARARRDILWKLEESLQWPRGYAERLARNPNLPVTPPAESSGPDVEGDSTTEAEILEAAGIADGVVQGLSDVTDPVQRRAIIAILTAAKRAVDEARDNPSD